MSFRRFALGAIASLGLASSIFSGCSTDLDTNAPYKEITVIYSVLNPAEKIHYVKVNKAFQNKNSDATAIAANIPDSTTYPAEDMQVKLQKLKVGTKGDTSVLAEYQLVRIDTTGKAPGTFYSGHQVLYRTESGKPGQLDASAVYRIVATNSRTGNVAKAATELVKPDNFCIYLVSREYATLPGGRCYSETNLSKYEPQFKNRVGFTTPPNAYIYTGKVEFDYTETTDGNTVNKSVSWYVSSNDLKAPTGSSDATIEWPIAENTFYSTLLSLIDTNKDNATTHRTAGNIRTIVTAGSSNLAKYYQANNSFSVFSQTLPNFDNVSNGTGLVASRRSLVAIANLTPDASKILINDSKYQKLKFQ